MTEGSYPIYINGTRQGELRVHQEGLLTVFSGECTDPGVLLRLSLYGEHEAYLGVMLPENGRLFLEKRFTRAAMAHFPRHPTHAGEAGATVFRESAPSTEDSPGENSPEKTPTAEAPEPEVPPSGSEKDTLWYAAPGGCLYTIGSGGRFLAVPENDARSRHHRGAVRRQIQGKSYLIFRTGSETP